jgi:hypothetical protein
MLAILENPWSHRRPETGLMCVDLGLLVRMLLNINEFNDRNTLPTEGGRRERSASDEYETPKASKGMPVRIWSRAPYLMIALG